MTTSHRFHSFQFRSDILWGSVASDCGVANHDVAEPDEEKRDDGLEVEIDHEEGESEDSEHNTMGATLNPYKEHI